ncbi:MAG: class I SAM-dependent methyltransferase [Chloroflexi bacterium]|nr:class I SAM-dependent methyltransferase [Chloroflexota bacterium]
MKEFLRNLHLNTGFKHRILMHRITEVFISSFITPHRLRLRPVPLASLATNPDTQIVLTNLPMNRNDSPYDDVAPVCLLAVSKQARRVLEIGTCRGRTTLSLALNLPSAAIVTYDIAPNAGAYLRGHPLAARIEMRVKDIHTDVARLRSEPPYDFIYVDGDHMGENPRRDSELAFSLLAPKGMIVWHDYANWGWALGLNTVPETLAEFARTRDIVAIERTVLAAYQGTA